MIERSASSGKERAYLRDVQYVTGAKLEARAYLHRTFSTASVSFAQFETDLLAWSPTATVLECGCGSGRFWESGDMPRTMHVLLTDISPGMVSDAVERARSCGFGEISGEVCDVQALPFPNETFDVVIANHMMYHVTNPDQGVAELARVVKRSGTVLVGTNGAGQMRELNDVVEEVFGNRVEDVNDVFGIEAGKAHLKTHFGSVVWHDYANELVVNDPAAVAAYGLSYPPGDLATESQQAEFREAVSRRFEAGPLRIRTRSGVFVCTAPRLPVTIAARS